MREKIIELCKRYFYLRAGEHAQNSKGTFVRCIIRDEDTAVHDFRRFLVSTVSYGGWVVEYIKEPHEKHGHWTVLPYLTSIGSILFRFKVKEASGFEYYTIFASTTLEALDKLAKEGRQVWERIVEMRTALDIMNDND